MDPTTRYDGAAAFFGLACIVHCFALPVIASAAPFVAASAGSEWAHWILTALSVAASLAVIASGHDARRASFLVPALFGMAALVFAVFSEQYGVDESIPAFVGGILLAGAHIYRLIKARRLGQIST